MMRMKKQQSKMKPKRIIIMKNKTLQKQWRYLIMKLIKMIFIATRITNKKKTFNHKTYKSKQMRLNIKRLLTKNQSTVNNKKKWHQKRRVQKFIMIASSLNNKLLTKNHKLMSQRLKINPGMAQTNQDFLKILESYLSLKL